MVSTVDRKGRQLTVFDHPSNTVEGSALGNVNWDTWCWHEMRRNRRKGARPTLIQNGGGRTAIFLL